MGVFCGEYITPVEETYFEHLDLLRGNRKKEKDIEMARQAVVSGVADGNAIEVAMGAANGIEVRKLAAKVNGVSIRTDVVGGEGSDEGDQRESPSQASALQDIGLHNLNDYAD